MVTIPQVCQRGRDWWSTEKMHGHCTAMGWKLESLQDLLQQPFLQHSVVLIQQRTA